MNVIKINYLWIFIENAQWMRTIDEHVQREIIEFLIFNVN